MIRNEDKALHLKFYFYFEAPHRKSALAAVMLREGVFALLPPVLSQTICG